MTVVTDPAGTHTGQDQLHKHTQGPSAPANRNVHWQGGEPGCLCSTSWVHGTAVYAVCVRSRGREGGREGGREERREGRGGNSQCVLREKGAGSNVRAVCVCRIPRALWCRRGAGTLAAALPATCSTENCTCKGDAKFSIIKIACCRVWVLEF